MLKNRRRVIAVAALTAIFAGAKWTTHRQDGDNKIKIERNVPYRQGDNSATLLDVYYRPSQGTLQPAVLVIHGGGFVSGSRTDATVVEPALRLAEAGYVVFAIDYRLFIESDRRNAWPAPLDDVQRAVRWVRAHAETYNIDPQCIGAYGISAGGGLAAHLGVRETRDHSHKDLVGFSSRVACVVDLAGPIDGSIPSSNPRDLAFTEAFLGGTLTDIPTVYRDASPLSHIIEQSAPFLVVHGAEDTIVSVEHARRLVATLREARIAVEYVEFPQAGHEVFDWNRIGQLTLRFLDQHLEPTRRTGHSKVFSQ